MKVYVGIIAICLLVVVELQAKAAHRIRKRSITEETLDDPNKCIETCTSNAPDIPENDPDFDNPMVQLCFLEKYSTGCLNKCPDSKSRSLLLETHVRTNLCDASSADIAKDSACVLEALGSSNTTCIPQCRQHEYWDVIPEVFADFEGENARNAIVVISEMDANVVSENLSAFCRQETCMIACQREPITQQCGQNAADKYLQYYGSWVKSSNKIYIGMGVIKTELADCGKVPV